MWKATKGYQPGRNQKHKAGMVGNWFYPSHLQSLSACRVCIRNRTSMVCWQGYCKQCVYISAFYISRGEYIWIWILPIVVPTWMSSLSLSVIILKWLMIWKYKFGRGVLQTSQQTSGSIGQVSMPGLVGETSYGGECGNEEAYGGLSAFGKK